MVPTRELHGTLLGAPVTLEHVRPQDSCCIENFCTSGLVERVFAR